MSFYQAKIKRHYPDSDPRHVEAYMRLEHGTLDHLTPKQFRTAAALAITCIIEGGIDAAEKLAKSYGL
jgi:hypothetical protein